ncbi:unnamed protein product [Danaus chrysippus]|uniref:(African queen) hypothetical protein n=1 Tax=Danaus chrysippus TaxID=151541 RepID=A0A8J2QQC4_9NEOP|nr:unnamed protein product [Danaus chrysippus]
MLRYTCSGEFKRKPRNHILCTRMRRMIYEGHDSKLAAVTTEFQLKGNLILHPLSPPSGHPQPATPSPAPSEVLLKLFEKTQHQATLHTPRPVYEVYLWLASKLIKFSSGVQAKQLIPISIIRGVVLRGRRSSRSRAREAAGGWPGGRERAAGEGCCAVMRADQYLMLPG